MPQLGALEVSKYHVRYLANTILFVNISNLFQWKVIYIMTFSATHWGILEVTVAQFSMQREDIIEYTNDDSHVFIFWYARETYQ